ncbi:MAG: GNAT family N-acetyltransferase [Desulforhopalus sp.]
MQYTWKYDQQGIDWEELSSLYRVAPLGDKKAGDLKKAFANSMYSCFVFKGSQLVGVGRALADGVDCSYLCDVAVHPDSQGEGLGKSIIKKLTSLSKGHKKIILYANPGTEGLYKKLGFMRMNTAMAIFQDQALALKAGLVIDG